MRRFLSNYFDLLSLFKKDSIDAPFCVIFGALVMGSRHYNLLPVRRLPSLVPRPHWSRQWLHERGRSLHPVMDPVPVLSCSVSRNGSSGYKWKRGVWNCPCTVVPWLDGVGQSNSMTWWTQCANLQRWVNRLFCVLSTLYSMQNGLFIAQSMSISAFP